jgi:hypothetical protein
MTILITEEQYSNLLLNESFDIDSTMEVIREKLFSPAGIAVETFLTSLGAATFGVTSGSVVLMYGSLLSYDVYKAINGVTNWFNIFIDIICVATSGMGAKLFSPVINAAKKINFKNIESVVIWLKKTTIWKNLSKIIESISSLMSIIVGYTLKGIEWVTKNTKVKILTNYASKIKSFLNNLIKPIEKYTITKATVQSGKQYVKQSAIFKGIENFSNMNNKSLYTAEDFKNLQSLYLQ